MNISNELNFEIKSTTIDSILNEIINQNNETDPFYIVDINQINIQHQKWINNLPTIKPYYAVKSNNDPKILERLNKLNTNFDCASLEEIKRVLSLGVHPSRIIYAHPCKQISHIKYASANGIDIMTFDSIEELDKIKQYHISPKLVIRIYVDDTTSVFQLGKKFGVHGDDVGELLIYAKDKGIEVIGVSFHVGSGTSNPSCYFYAIECARKAFDIGKSIGFDFKLLDIGGGFPSFRKHNVEFEDVCHYIKEGLDKYFNDMPDVQIIAEPGQFYCTPVFTLVTNIISKKTLKDGKKMYYINCGLFAGFTCFSYEPDALNYPLFYIKDNSEYKLQSNEFLEKNGYQFHDSKIWGPTCDSADIICESINLPDINITDWLIYPNMGSYTKVLETTFNSFPTPKLYYINHI